MSRTIFITGGTGLIGRRLVQHLLTRGDRILLLRRGRNGRDLPAGVTTIHGDVSTPGEWQRSVNGCDAVIHLAGAGIADRRWNARVLAEISESRIDGTHQVVEAIRMASRRPGVLLSGSAIGWYGETFGPVSEDEGQGPSDVLTELCARWEAQAIEAEAIGVRTVRLRTGLVLDARGGVLGKMLTPFRLGLGGRLGSGRQMMSWIHWADLIGLVEHAIGGRAEVRGALNGVAPKAVSNRVFTRALGRALHRPALFPVPYPALRMVAGSFARYIVMNQHVVPREAERTGYRFLFPELEEALREVLDPEGREAFGALGRAWSGREAAAPANRNVSSDVRVKPESTGAVSVRRSGIGLVVIGVEGALLRTDGRLAEGVALACRAAQRVGCVITFAGARPPRSLTPFAEAIGLEAPFIASNGALLWDRMREGEARALHHQSMEASLAAEVIAMARQAAPDVRIGIERLDRWYTDREDPGGAAALRADGVGLLESFLDAPVTQLCFLGSVEAITRVRSAIEPTLWRDRRIARFIASPTLLLVSHPMTDRGVALQRLAQRLGIERQRVMAIGGSIDDLGMLEWAGHPVAVESAPERVRGLAREIVPGAEDHGAARALHRFVIAPVTIAGDSGDRHASDAR